MSYIAAGCGKPLPKDAVAVYYDLLADLPLAALQAAAKAVLVEHVYPTFPTVGQIRQLATRIVAGKEGSLLAVEAWQMVCGIVRDYAFDDPLAHKAVVELPDKVRLVARAIGWRSIYNTAQSETLRAQFCRAWDAVAERDRKLQTLPGQVKAQIERQDVAKLTSGIGEMPGRG